MKVMIQFSHVHLRLGAVLFLTLIATVNSFSISQARPYTVNVAPPNTPFPRSKTMKTSTTLDVTAFPSILSKVPAWKYYSLLHIIGGTTGTPIVVRATKSWYKRIPLPSWTPPNFVFAPVWTLLYGLMGVSVSRIANAGSGGYKALNLWKAHYVLNLLWAPLFFGFQYLRIGLAINVVLVSTLLMILKSFYAIDPLAAYLQVPYLLWLIYATKLNQAICKLNPVISGINEARLQADLCADGDGYNSAMLEYDIAKLQAAAMKYAEL